MLSGRRNSPAPELPSKGNEMNMTTAKRLASRRRRRACGDARQHDGRRAELSDQADHGDHPVCRRQRQRRRRRIMLDKMSKNMGQPIIVENRPGAGGNSGTGAAAKADAGRLHAGRRRLRPGRGQPHALQGARLRPREGPGDDLAVRGLHHRRGGQQEPAGPFAQGAGRVRQGQSGQAQLRLGRHRQLAASGRRIFLRRSTA